MLDCGRSELLVNVMWLPSGDQFGASASSRGAVSGARTPSADAGDPHLRDDAIEPESGEGEAAAIC
jgi:hypothetical protein